MKTFLILALALVLGCDNHRHQHVITAKTYALPPDGAPIPEKDSEGNDILYGPITLECSLEVGGHKMENPIFWLNASRLRAYRFATTEHERVKILFGAEGAAPRETEIRP